MDGLLALLQVVMIDLILAGDNALVIGAVAARLPEHQRRKTIAIGIGFAIAVRLLFTLIASWLMSLPVLGIIGGLALFWIAWGLWRDRAGDEASEAQMAKSPLSLAHAVWIIFVADVSMSLDNVLGVAGAAEGHTFALIVGLVLSMVLMGSAATFIAAQMKRWPWLIYLGIVAIVFAGVGLIYRGLGL